MTSQNQMVLDYILKHGSIDQWRAVNELHILRLSARIWDLRKQGVPIRAVMRRNSKSHWSEYSLKEPPASAKANDSKDEAVRTGFASDNITNL